MTHIEIDWAKRYRQGARQRLLRFLRRGRPIFEITGTWSGYSSSQSRICHRIYITDSQKAEKVEQLHSIRFSDNTSLWISVHQISRKEDLHEENDQYSSLINSCLDQGVNSVIALKEK